MNKIDFNGYTPSSPARCGSTAKKRVPLESVDTATQQAIEQRSTDLASRFPNQLTFSLEEVAAIMNVNYESVRRRVADGRIASIHIGRRPLIPLHEIARILTTGVP